MTKLEKEFRAAVKQGVPEIKAAVSNLEQVCEKYGIPFCMSFEQAKIKYNPQSFSEKWGELDNVWDILDDLCVEFWSGYDDGEVGWQASYNC